MWYCTPAILLLGRFIGRRIRSSKSSSVIYKVGDQPVCKKEKIVYAIYLLTNLDLIITNISDFGCYRDGSAVKSITVLPEDLS